MADPIHIPDETREELDSNVSYTPTLSTPQKWCDTHPALTNPYPQGCVFPDVYQGHFSRLLIRREEIIDRASALAELISEDYKDKRPVLVCVLKGAAPVRIGDRGSGPLALGSGY